MKSKNIIEEVFWFMMPEGLDILFDLENCEKMGNKIRITLKEKNIIPSDLPEKYHGKNITDTSLDNIIIDYFPIKGKKGEILLKRRSWKFEGADEWFKRDIKLCAPGTRLEKEFADFLKDFPGDASDFDFAYSGYEPSES